MRKRRKNPVKLSCRQDWGRGYKNRYFVSAAIVREKLKLIRERDKKRKHKERIYRLIQSKHDAI